MAAIYIDGPHHDYPEQRDIDEAQEDCLEDFGYRVIRFGYRDDWDEIFRRCKHIFGGEA